MQNIYILSQLSKDMSHTISYQYINILPHHSCNINNKDMISFSQLQPSRFIIAQTWIFWAGLIGGWAQEDTKSQMKTSILSDTWAEKEDNVGSNNTEKKMNRVTVLWIILKLKRWNMYKKQGRHRKHREDPRDHSDWDGQKMRYGM